MALPSTVRVKLSSEAAEAISITPVVVQEMPVRELIEHALGVAGKDEARIREILLRGVLVAGASRLRWAGWEAEPESLREALAGFPDPDPRLPFDAGRCVRAVLRVAPSGEFVRPGPGVIEIPREAGLRKGLFQRGTFWDALMQAVGGGAAYAGYSYRDRADRYVREFGPEEIGRLRAASGTLKYATLRERVRSVAFTGVELFAVR